MKKTIKSLLALAVAAFAFTACSDVPEPEGYNSRQGDGLIDYTPEGVGTLASPYNVAGVLQATKDLAKGAKTGEIYTKGFVSKKEFSSQYGSFNYYITDNKEGKSKAFYVYSGIGLNKEKFTSENDLNVGDAVTICGTIVNFNGTIEYEKQNYLVELNGKTSGGGGGGGDAIEVTCAEAVTATNNLADNATSTETYAVTGYITEVVGSVSRNQQTFWIADTKDGGKVFEAYYADLPDGVTEFKKGMKVKITGNLIKFVNSSTGAVTPEIKNAKVEILESGDEPGGGGGDVISVTCAEAVTATNKLADGATSTETYAVTGYITEVVGSVSRNQQTFWMADTKDGGKVFEAYYADLPSGISAFAVGMKVKITGNLMKFVNSSTGAVTPEIKNATVEVLEGGGESGGESGGGSGSGYGTLSGNVLTLNCAGLGLENNPASIALVDGTTITLAKNDGNNNPAYNGSFGELRFYARNSFTINAGSKTIASVKLYCTANNNVPCVGNEGEVTASAGTLDIQKEAMTIEAKNVNKSSFTLTNGFAEKTSGGTQIRFNKMEITYAQ